MSQAADEFELFDLRVEVIGRQEDMVCSHRAGDHFFVRGENISLPDGQSFSLYSLAALLPLLPAKQRDTHINDWMTSDEVVACPDPHCGAQFRIQRIGRRTFRRSDVTATQLPRPDQGPAS